MKAIKRRRSTVKNISQITKAMNLVATSKLQRARANLAAVGKPVQATLEVIYNTISDIDTIAMESFDRPFILSNSSKGDDKAKNVAYIIITGNRGLCGGYNSSACKELVKHAKANEIKNPLIIPLGTKGRDYFKRRNSKLHEMPAPSEPPTFAEAKTVADQIVSMYETKVDGSWMVDEVYLVYTQFRTILNLEPIVRKVMPLDPDYLRRVVGTELRDGEEWEDVGFFPRPETKPNTLHKQEMEYEPGMEEVLRSVVPWYLCMFIHAALASSALCEQAARMTSMDSATKNAGEIIDKLTLLFNRQRQSIITQEITEIVSGANALN